jgi:hypothetical protein
MDLKELTELIVIRNYVGNAIGLSAIEKSTIRELDGILLLLDKKIIAILTGTKFKEYVDYDHVKEAKINAVKVSNIYSGMEDLKKK